jgi:hypothetical protein
VLAVRWPTVPLAGVSPAVRWKRITDRCVPEPKLPSVEVGMPTSASQLCPASRAELGESQDHSSIGVGTFTGHSARDRLVAFARARAQAGTRTEPLVPGPGRARERTPANE